MSCIDCYECHKLWSKEREIDVPYRKGIAKLHILRIVRASSINELPVDLIITASASIRSEPVEFGVIFSDEPPLAGTYPLPVLWRHSRGPMIGKWIAPKSKI